MENVILVDEQDQEVGIEEKLAAHIQGKLHRAVSVFLFNSQKELLIQQRAFSKYHSGGLWSNTCCGHPRPEESAINAATRRLYEELGIKASLSKLFDFTYRADLDHGLIEHEFDHVFIGKFNGNIQLNPDEVNAYAWISPEKLFKAIEERPQEFTVWFKLVLPKVLKMVRDV
jgi:isopentenyl-diphosphate delta-isomerase